MSNNKKFHINSQGQIKECTATEGRCPYQRHFFSYQEAQRYADESNKSYWDYAILKNQISNKTRKLIIAQDRFEKSYESLLRVYNNTIILGAKKQLGETHSSEDYFNHHDYFQHENNSVEEFVFKNTHLNNMPELQEKVLGQWSWRYETSAFKPKYDEYLNGLSTQRFEPLTEEMERISHNYNQQARKEDFLKADPEFYENNPKILERDFNNVKDKFVPYIRYYRHKEVSKKTVALANETMPLKEKLESMYARKDYKAILMTPEFKTIHDATQGLRDAQDKLYDLLYKKNQFIKRHPEATKDPK